MGLLNTVSREQYDTMKQDRDDWRTRYDALFAAYEIESRLWPNCVPEPNTGCWLWERSTHVFGYGQISIENKPHGAHRVAYAAMYGAIPDGMEVCHSCDEPSCINPSHLFLGTHADNMRDMRAKGRSMAGAYLAARTVCANGHPFSAENTKRRADGSRKCRECSRDYMRRKRAGGKVA